MSDDIVIRNMTRGEVDLLIEWAALEGWNPGVHDAELFWNTDSDAFVAAELGGDLIGGGAITSYGGEFGFMGFFIVRPEYRGKGLGDRLWHARCERLVERLKPGASIGMDGVFNMQDYYAKGGFKFSHRDIRYEYEGPAPIAEEGTMDSIAPLSDVSLEKLNAYDRACFPAPRTGFLSHWIAQPNALSLACLRQGVLSGYGVIRTCREGFKIGPLFADDDNAATALFAGLAQFGSPGPIYLDVPENNPAAVALAKRYQMKEVFGCARMYLGQFPEVAHERLCGV